MLEQIKASAGSGKTYTLTRRFLELLLESRAEPALSPCRKDRPQPGRMLSALSEILAMTFTNKAAAEMKERVVETLKKAALGQEEISFESGRRFTPEQAEAWVRTILRRYDALNIRTIDSLLMLLVRISAVSLTLPPDFELVFNEGEFLDPLYDELQDLAASGDAEACALFERAADFLLQSNMEGFIPHGRIRELVLETLSMLEKREAEPCTDAPALLALRAKCAGRIARAGQKLQKAIDSSGLDCIQRFKDFMDKCEQAQEGGKWPVDSACASYPEFSKCVKTAWHGSIKASHEKAYADFCAVLHGEAAKIGLLDSAIRLLPFAVAAQTLRGRLHQLYAASGELPSSRLPILARKVLDGTRGVSEACCRMGSRLTHLLIDEFQDTSREQWEAIEPLAQECLARGGSLRYVGDVKQAIYSWRGGDSALFDDIAEREALKNIAPKPRLTPLGENWRSSPAVVEFNNKFFGRLEDPERAFAAARMLFPKNYPEDEIRKASGVLSRAFRGAAQQIPPARAAKAAQGLVSIARFEAESKEELPEEIRARFIKLFQKDLLPRRGLGEIAVLTRKSKEAALVADWLAELGVSFMTEHSFSLAANPLIRRLIAFLRFLDYPPDDLSFWNFISGPECFGQVCGLSQSDLEDWLAARRLAAQRGQKSEKKSLFTLFRRDFPEEWRLFLEPFHNRSGLMSAYDLISELYARYGLLHKRPAERIYLERFLEVLHAAENRGLSAPSAFLEFWADKGAEEKIPAPENPDSVRIMTLHKAKGLEFPVVVMPFHSFSEKRDRNLGLANVEGKDLLVVEGPDLGEEYYRGRNRSALEKIHLVYVGWTRASEELHLLVGNYPNELKNASIPRLLDELLRPYPFKDEIFELGQRPRPSRAKGRGRPEAGEAPGGKPEAADAAKGAPRPENVPGHEGAEGPGSEEEPGGAPGPDYDESWLPMGWLPALKIFRNPVPELVYDERVRGLLFHHCLENLYIPEEPQDGEDLQEGLRRAVEITLRSFRLPLDDPEKAGKELLDMLGWFRALPQAPFWLRQGLPEQEILDEKGRLHRIDLLVESEEEILVIDYKSGRASPDHREQILGYLALLEAGQGKSSASKPKKRRGLLIYLDEKRLEEVLP
ncbi:UvrD-helicase domain-containing protein [Desulfovibrio sp. OttesenSCG-928-C14]|nr:UvrD-helicase domain-containing protein [Desulfovibrio sp. OttesenSCG-928-C14]